ncbi:MAG: hypothetical protein SH856_05595 [Flavobacteriales bacterium]|nr:hypothetical protein [Flavobacteriales bacterium]
MNRIDELFRAKLNIMDTKPNADDLRNMDALLGKKKKRRIGGWWWFVIVLLCGSAIGVSVFNHRPQGAVVKNKIKEQSLTNIDSAAAPSTADGINSQANQLQEKPSSESIAETIKDIRNRSTEDAITKAGYSDLVSNKKDLRSKTQDRNKPNFGPPADDKFIEASKQSSKSKLNDDADANSEKKTIRDEYDLDDHKTEVDSNEKASQFQDLIKIGGEEETSDSGTFVNDEIALKTAIFPSTPDTTRLDSLEARVLFLPTHDDSLDNRNLRFWELQIGFGYNRLESMNNVRFAIEDLSLTKKIDWWQRDFGIRLNCEHYQFGLTFSIAEYKRLIEPLRYYSTREFYQNFNGNIQSEFFDKPEFKSFLENYSAITKVKQWALSPMIGYHLFQPAKKLDVIPKMAANIELNASDLRYYQIGTTEFYYESSDTVWADYTTWFEPRTTTNTSYSVSANAALELRIKLGNRFHACIEPGFRYQLWCIKKDITPKLMSYYVRFGVGINF